MHVLLTYLVLTATPDILFDSRDPAIEQRKEQNEFEFQITAGAWLPRLGGESTLGPPSTAPGIDLGFQLLLDDLEPTANFEIEIRRNDIWQFDISGFDFSTSGVGPFTGSATFGSLTLSDGDPIRTSFDITSLAVELSYWGWKRFDRNDGDRVDFWIAPMFGTRFVDVDQSIQMIPGPREDAQGEWVSPYAGFKMKLLCPMSYYDDFDWMESIEINGSLGLGPSFGGEGGAMVNLSTGITANISDNFGVQFGYRLLEMDVETDLYEFRGGLQGLFLAGSLQF